VDIDGRNISAKNITFILIACCATIHLSSTEAEVTNLPYTSSYLIFIQSQTIREQGWAAIDEGTLHIKLWKRHWGGAINLSQQLRKEMGECGEVLWSCQGTPVPDLLRHVPLPHIAFQCQTHITDHSLTLEHTTRTTDSTTLRWTYIYIVFLCS